MNRLSIACLSLAAMTFSTACSAVFSSADEEKDNAPSGDAVETPDGGSAQGPSTITGGEVDAGEVDAVAAPVKADAGPPAPPGCDASKLPTEDPCVVRDSMGIFVAKSGSDAAGDGTRAKPFATIAKANAKASSSSLSRVYACADTYPEPITLVDGVSIFGYFDCANGWRVDTKLKAVVASPTSPALRGTSLKKTMRVESFDVRAPDATVPSGSSIGAIVTDAAGLTFEAVAIRAGKGLAGADGVEPPELTPSLPVDYNGKAGSKFGRCSGLDTLCTILFRGGSGGVNACTGVPGLAGGDGGRGGTGGKLDVTPQHIGIVPISSGDGESTTVDPKTARGGKGEIGSGGSNGADGANGSDGASGGSGVGSITEAGFTPSNGAHGTNGAPGQGGGGGGAKLPDPATLAEGTYWGYPGGGGGAGGCPGVAGPAGGGGGASIGVIAFRSIVHFSHSEVHANDAGHGGKGTLGSARSPGGEGADGYISLPVLKGGNGGAGGLAGTSGHGAGGPSIGIAYKGSLPDLGTMTPTVGAAGKGQVKLVGAYGPSTRTVEASVDGIAQPVFSIP